MSGTGRGGVGLHALRRVPIATAVAWAAAALAAPSMASAQIAKFPPPEGADSVTVIPGLRYRATGLKSWFLGAAYRDVWDTPVTVEVLDLDEQAGGLTPRETGGFGQTYVLEFDGADGLQYRVRSLDKAATRRLDPTLQNTVIASIMQDQVAAFIPTGALVVDPLMEAVGLLHATHRFVIVPDDPRLGEYREEFAGLVSLFVDRPEEGPGNTPGFGGSTRIAGSATLFEELEEGACNRINARAFLKARYMDMLIGDRDRHPGQFRWARYPSGADCFVWEPIPVDRDEAFLRHDGFLMAIYRLIEPRLIKFDPTYPNLVGLTFNAWEIDRQLLSELTEDVWRETAEEMQRELTDSVIDDAVHRLPAPHYELHGAFIASALKSRRDDLVDEALAYYRLITHQPEIKGTDRDERAVFEHLENGDLRLTLWYLDGPMSARPYFERTFHRAETSEVRLYLQGGDDLVEVHGARGAITVRAIGGGGADRYLNDSRAGGGRTRFYDDRGETRVEGAGRLDTRSFERPPPNNLSHKYGLDWGGLNRYSPKIDYDPDTGLKTGLTVGFLRYGFRKVPWKSNNAFEAGFATEGPELFAGWHARLRDAIWDADFTLEAGYTGLDILRFYGFGNETESTGGSEFFKVEQREFNFAPGLEWSWGQAVGKDEEFELEVTVPALRPAVRLGVGPVLRYSDTPLDQDADRFIATLDPAPLGVGGFGQVGGRLWVEIDKRNRPAYPSRGFRIEAGASAFPSIWDVDGAFGEVHGAISTFLTPGGSVRAPTLALRAGAKNVFGTFPFHESAFIGGGHNLRGFRKGRFAGDAAAFANAELRIPVTEFNLLFPTEFGVLGAADVGRVFFEGDPDTADSWHSGFGGGIWFTLLNRSQSFSITLVDGDDLLGVYIRAGFHF